MSDEQPPVEEPDRPDEAVPSVGPAAATELPPAEPSRRQLPLSRLILGLVLVAIGVIWLLAALDVVSFSLLAALPGALIVVGIVLIAAARTGRHSPLIVLGVILTVILTLASSLDIRLQGGVGERTERPAALADVQSEYRLSVGQLTIDLTAVDFSESQNTLVTASIGIGQLEVRVPEGAQVVAVAHAGAGQVMVFGREENGFDVDLTARRPPGLEVARATGVLTLDLSVGLGQIEVRA